MIAKLERSFEIHSTGVLLLLKDCIVVKKKSACQPNISVFLALTNHEVQKALLDHGQLGQFLTNDEVEMLINLVVILETMEIGFLMPTKSWISLLQNSRKISCLLEKECMSNLS